MDSEYLRSIWKPIEEEKAHMCLEEIYSKKGFLVRNLHRNDRVHESGADLLCTKSEVSIGFAVKKKPRQEDIPQLKKLASLDPSIIKFYIYLDDPTRSFEKAMASHPDIHYLDRGKFHSMLIHNGSIKYVLLYFAAHKLIENLSSIYELLYEKRMSKRYEQKLDSEEATLMWNIKDDAVKLKSILEYLQSKWRPILMTRLEYNRKEWASYIIDLHKELDIVNNIAGESLHNTFNTMSREFPRLVSSYWAIASYRTVWKDFTATAIKLAKKSSKEVKDFIRYKWVMPTLEHNRRSSEYGPIGSIYSTLWAIIESTYHIADDLENGIDWLYHDLA